MKIVSFLLLWLASFLAYAQHSSFILGQIEGNPDLKPQSIQLDIVQLVEKEIPQLGVFKKEKDYNNYPPDDNKITYPELSYTSIQSKVLDSGGLFVMTGWNGRLLLLNISGTNYDQILNWGIITNVTLDSIKSENYFYVSDTCNLSHDFEIFPIGEKFYLFNPFSAFSMSSSFTKYEYHYLPTIWNKSVPHEYNAEMPLYNIWQLKPFVNKATGNESYRIINIIFWDSTFRFEFYFKKNKGDSNNIYSLSKKYIVELSKSFEVVNHYPLQDLVGSYLHFDYKDFGLPCNLISFKELYLCDKLLSKSIDNKRDYNFELSSSDSIDKFIMKINGKFGNKKFFQTPFGIVNDFQVKNMDATCGQLGYANYSNISFSIYNFRTNRDTILELRIPKKFSPYYDNNRNVLLTKENYLQGIFIDWPSTFDKKIISIFIFKFPYSENHNSNSYKISMGNNKKGEIEFKLTTNGYLEKVNIQMYSKNNEGQLDGNDMIQYENSFRVYFFKHLFRHPQFKGKKTGTYGTSSIILKSDSTHNLKLPAGTYYFRTRPDYKSNYNNYSVPIHDYYPRPRDYYKIYKDDYYYFLKMIRMPYNKNEIIEYAFKIKIRRFGKPRITKIKLKKNRDYE